DEQKLQGTWAIVKLEAKGKEMPQDQSDKDRLHWTFAGSKLHTKSSLGEHELTYQLDAKQSPKHIDTVLDEANKYLGIYELNGDELKICQTHIDTGNIRPTDFTAKERGALMIFKRVK